MIVLGLTLAGVVAAGPLLFGGERQGWVLTSADGVPQRLITHVAEIRPIDLAVSANEERWAVVGAGANGRKALFLVDRKQGRRRIQLPGDQCAAPIFSADGQTIYVSANDLTAKPIAGHRMNYVQLWKIDFASGAKQKLTSSPGCHMWPSPLPSGQILYSHATCVGGRGFEILDTNRREQVILPPTEEFGEPVPHSDGRRVAFWRANSTGIEVAEWDLKTSTERKLGRIRAEGDRLRLAWHSDERSLLFQTRGSVWRMSEGSDATELFRISEVGAKP